MPFLSKRKINPKLIDTKLCKWNHGFHSKWMKLTILIPFFCFIPVCSSSPLPDLIKYLFSISEMNAFASMETGKGCTGHFTLQVTARIIWSKDTYTTSWFLLRFPRCFHPFTPPSCGKWLIATLESHFSASKWKLILLDKPSF